MTAAATLRRGSRGNVAGRGAHPVTGWPVLRAAALCRQRSSSQWRRRARTADQPPCKVAASPARPCGFVGFKPPASKRTPQKPHHTQKSTFYASAAALPLILLFAICGCHKRTTREVVVAPSAQPTTRLRLIDIAPFVRHTDTRLLFYLLILQLDLIQVQNNNCTATLYLVLETKQTKEMEVIKKRLHTYKVELENATERAEKSEAQLKEHVLRADRAEQETLALTRRINLLETSIEKSEERLKAANEKFQQATQVADESERARKMLEHKVATSEEVLETLETSLREAKQLAENSDGKYEEVSRKLRLVEGDLEKAEERAKKAELKQAEYEEELKVVGNNLRSFELNEEKQLERQQAFELTVRNAQQRLGEAESRAEFAERTVQKLQKEVDRLEDVLTLEREKYKHISEELDQTFSELTAC